jgi:hypothetical protein
LRKEEKMGEENKREGNVMMVLYRAFMPLYSHLPLAMAVAAIRIVVTIGIATGAHFVVT